MALNQQFQAPAGLTFDARIEQPLEPGQPRLFWDGPSGAWVADASARVAVLPDPTLAGNYLVQVPSTQTAGWPAKIYWITAEARGVALTIAPWVAYVVGGDDGTMPSPEVDLPLPGGGVLHVRGAYVRPAPPAAPAPTRP